MSFNNTERKKNVVIYNGNVLDTYVDFFCGARDQNRLRPAHTQLDTAGRTSLNE